MGGEGDGHSSSRKGYQEWRIPNPMILVLMTQIVTEPRTSCVSTWRPTSLEQARWLPPPHPEAMPRWAWSTGPYW